MQQHPFYLLHISNTHTVVALLCRAASSTLPKDHDEDVQCRGPHTREEGEAENDVGLLRHALLRQPLSGPFQSMSVERVVLTLYRHALALPNLHCKYVKC